MTANKTHSNRKKRTVDEVFRELSTQDEVVIDERCAKVILRPREKEVIYEELRSCRISLPKADPIEERAKQKLFKDLYKNKSTKMRYIEQPGPTREEVESGVDKVDDLLISSSNANDKANQPVLPDAIAKN